MRAQILNLGKCVKIFLGVKMKSKYILCDWTRSPTEALFHKRFKTELNVITFNKEFLGLV